MAMNIHRNRGSYDGIWLLDNKALKAIDDILDEEWRRLQEIRSQKIKEAAEKKFKSLMQDKNGKGTFPIFSFNFRTSRDNYISYLKTNSTFRLRINRRNI